MRKTLALVGCGAIAQAVARIAARGFGMRVLGYARSPREVPSADFAGVSTDYAEVANRADFISLHIPGSPTDRPTLAGSEGSTGDLRAGFFGMLVVGVLVLVFTFLHRQEMFLPMFLGHSGGKGKFGGDGVLAVREEIIKTLG